MDIKRGGGYAFLHLLPLLSSTQLSLMSEAPLGTKKVLQTNIKIEAKKTVNETQVKKKKKKHLLKSIKSIINEPSL